MFGPGSESDNLADALEPADLTGLRWIAQVAPWSHHDAQVTSSDPRVGDIDENVTMSKLWSIDRHNFGAELARLVVNKCRMLERDGHRIHC